MRLPVFLVEDGSITDAQVRRLREKRISGKTLVATAAAAGMSERTARHWQSGALPSTAKAPRTWWTREDPFAGVWESEVVPQLVADTEGRLQVLTLFTWMCRPPLMSRKLLIYHCVGSILRCYFSPCTPLSEPESTGLQEPAADDLGTSSQVVLMCPFSLRDDRLAAACRRPAP